MFKDCLTLLFKLLLLICIFPLYAEEVVSPEVHYADIPGWVKPAKPKHQNSKSTTDISVRYLLSDQQTNISDAGIAYFTQVVLQPVKEQGLEEVSEISFDFNPDFETLTLHQITILRDGEESTRLSPEDIKIFNNETDLNKRQYGGRATALAILKDIRVGDIISYAYTTQGMNPVLGKKRFGRFITQWAVAVEQINLRLVAQAETKIEFKSKGLKYAKNTEEGISEYLWQLNDVPAIVEEDQYPSWFTPYSMIEFSEYRNWQEVNEWALELYSDVSTSKALAKQIGEWQAQSPDLEQQVEAAIRFVQDEVRYFGIEVGQNTHRPHSPAEVFERRFGDCKDKTMLLITIFKQLGLSASPALVSSFAGRVLDEHLASPGNFDHVIVYLNHNNKDYWIDGTISHQRGGLDKMGFVNYHRALVVKDGHKELVKITRPADRLSNIHTQENFEFNSEGDQATLTVTTSYSGMKADSIRYQIATAGVKKLTENYLNFYNQYFTNIESVSEVVVDDDATNNKVVTMETYQVKDWTVKDAGKRLIETYAVGLKEYLVTPNVLNRKHPFAVSSGFEMTHQQSVKLYDNKRLRFDVEKIENRNDYFEYQKTTTRDDDLVSVTHHFKPLRSFVDAKNTADYVAQVKELKENLGMRFITLDKKSSTVNEQQDRLRALARKIIKKN
jgi:hypothetical protein